jgi:hypothetical protein
MQGYPIFTGITHGYEAQAPRDEGRDSIDRPDRRWPACAHSASTSTSGTIRGTYPFWYSSIRRASSVRSQEGKFLLKYPAVCCKTFTLRGTVAGFFRISMSRAIEEPPVIEKILRHCSLWNSGKKNLSGLHQPKWLQRRKDKTSIRNR